MNTHRLAQSLGRLGGLARARNLSRERRRQIASLGGRSKALSRDAAQRVRDNFIYLEIVDALKKAARRHGF